jgi:hypothetical protein
MAARVEQLAPRLVAVEMLAAAASQAQGRATGRGIADAFL